MKGVLNSAMDARYLRHLRGESTIMELFAPQFYLMTREHSAIQLTPRCLPEVRLGIRGTVVVAGVSLSVLAGDTLREKTAAMEQLTITRTDLPAPVSADVERDATVDSRRRPNPCKPNPYP